MLVFNLTNKPIVYRNRTIPAEGSFDYKDMGFVPDRDKALAKAKILAFGSRPPLWQSAEPAPMTTADAVALAASRAKVAPKPLPQEAVPEFIRVEGEDKFDGNPKKKKF